MNIPGKSVAHRLLHAMGMHNAETQVTAVEQQCLARYARGRTRLVEIGVYEGASTRLLIESAAPHADLFAVDPFLRGRLGICWSKGVAMSEIASALQRNPGVRVHVVEKFSYEAAGEIEGGFDFVFIDGDHSLDGIRRDWQDWSGRLAKGGIMALHDTRVPAHNPRVADLGSFQYFESTIRRDPAYELREQIDSLSVLQRRSS